MSVRCKAAKYADWYCFVCRYLAWRLLSSKLIQNTIVIS